LTQLTFGNKKFCRYSITQLFGRIVCGLHSAHSVGAAFGTCAPSPDAFTKLAQRYLAEHADPNLALRAFWDIGGAGARADATAREDEYARGNQKVHFLYDPSIFICCLAFSGYTRWPYSCGLS
jgi:hypothetical protein